MLDDKKLKILCVDDDVVMLELVCSFISSLGYEALEAVTFEQAIEKFNAEQPQIIICDWKLDDKDGLEICREIRKISTVGYVYFILLTSYGGDRNAAVAMEAGIDDFLTKPVKRNELTQRLNVATRIIQAINHKEKNHHHPEEGLPVCVYCKAVSDNRTEWTPVETFISKITDQPILPDICPTCYDRVMRFNSPRTNLI
ncbi:response regulator [Oscillatoria amoena NRMC-F 0135]|nr:response regulator [Oscillatoria amoena NRMC-F 0135]MDL5053492.1 response regulator [Oscillatoria laete-virens NRMC-F 0139]